MKTKKHCAILVCLFFVCWLSSCNSVGGGNKKAEEMLVQLQRDTLASKGGHGYFVMNFIVGRIKQTPITEGLPYQVNILSIAPELTGQEIPIRILDSINYQISFPKNEHEDTLIKGEFGKQAGNNKIQLIVNKTNIFPDSSKTEVFEALKVITYMFKVHTY